MTQCAPPLISDHLQKATTYPKCSWSKSHNWTSSKRPPFVSDCNHVLGWRFYNFSLFLTFYKRPLDALSPLCTTQLGVQWNLSFGTVLFKDHKIWSGKNVHIIFVFFALKGHLRPGKRDTFSGSRKPGSLHSGNFLAFKSDWPQKVVYYFWPSLVTMARALHKMNYLT